VENFVMMAINEVVAVVQAEAVVEVPVAVHRVVVAVPVVVEVER
jgi:hypothetical protein